MLGLLQATGNLAFSGVCTQWLGICGFFWGGWQLRGRIWDFFGL